VLIVLIGHAMDSFSRLACAASLNQVGDEGGHDGRVSLLTPFITRLRVKDATFGKPTQEVDAGRVSRTSQLGDYSYYCEPLRHIANTTVGKFAKHRGLMCGSGPQTTRLEKASPASLSLPCRPTNFDDATDDDAWFRAPAVGGAFALGHANVAWATAPTVRPEVTIGHGARCGGRGGS